MELIRTGAKSNRVNWGEMLLFFCTYYVLKHADAAHYYGHSRVLQLLCGEATCSFMHSRVYEC